MVFYGTTNWRYQAKNSKRLLILRTCHFSDAFRWLREQINSIWSMIPLHAIPLERTFSFGCELFSYTMCAALNSMNECSQQQQKRSKIRRIYSYSDFLPFDKFNASPTCEHCTSHGYVLRLELVFVCHKKKASTHAHQRAQRFHSI